MEMMFLKASVLCAADREKTGKGQSHERALGIIHLKLGLQALDMVLDKVLEEKSGVALEWSRLLVQTLGDPGRKVVFPVDTTDAYDRASIQPDRGVHPFLEVILDAFRENDIRHLVGIRHTDVEYHSVI